MLQFGWDPGKAKLNVKKHGITFPEVATVFADAFSATFSDPDHSVGEERYITVGMSEIGKVLIISHTDRRDRIRLISARKTTCRERKYYEERK